jgi:peptidoglycan/LPS O-acetylase OafA/YrhL
VAIIASVTALGNAMWGPLIFSTTSTGVTADRGVGYNWFAFGVGGILGVLGLIVAQKRPVPGRIALAVGGALLIAVPFVYENRPMLPIATSVVLGIAMLVSSFFLGPMPAPRHMPEGHEARR